MLEKQVRVDGAILNLDKILIKQYQKVSKSLIRKINAVYQKILNEHDGQIQVSHLYEYNRYYELLAQINEEADGLGYSQLTTFPKEMTKLYKQNRKDLSNFFPLNSELNADLAERALKQIWVQDGLRWDDRIWRNTDMLKQVLQDGIFEAISTGSGVDELTSILMGKFDSSFYQAQRLARTELMHIYNQSSLDSYEEAFKDEPVILVEWLTAKESVTNYNLGYTSQGTDLYNHRYQKMNSKYRKKKGEVCSKCIDISERDVGYGAGIYPIDQVPTDVHPNCRCTTVVAEAMFQY